MKKFYLLLIGCVLIMIFSLGFTIMASGPSKQISGEKHIQLKCLNCKKEYAFEEEIKFNILYEDKEDLFINFGIKLYSGGDWKLLADDVRAAGSSHKIASWKFSSGEVKEVKWDKHVMLSPEKLKRDNVSLPEDSEIISYDITRGGYLMLFGWKVSPLSHGIHEPIHKFNLLPKKQKGKKQ